MKKWMVALVVACVLLVSNGATSFASDAPPIFNPPQHYYLALGDSLAFGYQAATFNQNFPVEPPTAFSTGYVDDFTSMLQDVRPQLQAINFGCTGETTVTFIQGGCIYTAQGFQLHNGYAGSQLSAAVAFLRQHPGQVSPITLNMVYDNDSYNFGPFVPLVHLLLSKVTLPFQRVSSGERLSFCASSLVSSSAFPKSLVRETSPGAFSSGWEDRIRELVTAAPGRTGNGQSD